MYVENRIVGKDAQSFDELKGEKGSLAFFFPFPRFQNLITKKLEISEKNLAEVI